MSITRDMNAGRAGRRRIDYFPSKEALELIARNRGLQSLSEAINRLVTLNEAAQGDMGSSMVALVEAEKAAGFVSWDGRPEEALNAIREVAESRGISLAKAIAELAATARQTLAQREATQC